MTLSRCLNGKIEEILQDALLSDLVKMEGIYLLYEKSSEKDKRKLQPKIDALAETLKFDSIVGQWLNHPADSWERGFANRHKESTGWRLLLGGTYKKGVEKEDVIVEPFAVQKYTVTQESWKGVMGDEPSSFSDRPAAPVESVSFYDCCCYCNTVSLLSGEEPSYFFQLDPEGTCIEPLLSMNGLEKEIYAVFENVETRGPLLPTESQWEYACRAGTATNTYNGDLGEDTKENNRILSEIAWFHDNTQHDKRPQEVGQLKPNAWDIYDTIGNVWEWTSTPYN